MQLLISTCLFVPYSQIRFEAAVETFMLSCAGYCVATYVLVGVVICMWWVWLCVCTHARDYDTCVVYTTGYW